MKRFAVMVAAGLIILTLPLHVMAQAKEQGFFLGGGATYAWENFDDDDIEDLNNDPDISGLTADFDDAWGLNLFAGYKFMRYLAIEANYNYYEDFDLDVDARVFDIPVSLEFDVEVWTLTADLIAMYPVYNDRLVPYLRLGGGYMDAEIEGYGADEDESDFAFNLGAGIDYYFNESVSLGFDGKYVWGTGDLDELEYFVGAIRLGFHF